MLMDVQHHLLKEAQPLLLSILGYLEHLLHIFHVPRVTTIQLIQGSLIALLRLRRDTRKQPLIKIKILPISGLSDQKKHSLCLLLNRIVMKHTM